MEETGTLGEKRESSDVSGSDAFTKKLLNGFQSPKKKVKDDHPGPGENGHKNGNGTCVNGRDESHSAIITVKSKDFFLTGKDGSAKDQVLGNGHSPHPVPAADQHEHPDQGEREAKGSSFLTGYLGSWKRSRYLSGNFSVSGDTMEGIVQCLVFLKAFSVRTLSPYFLYSLWL